VLLLGRGAWRECLISWCCSARRRRSDDRNLSRGDTGDSFDDKHVGGGNSLCQAKQGGRACGNEEGRRLGLIKLFKEGGPVMWPLLLSLLIGIVFTIERAIVFWMGRINPREFMMKVNSFIGKGDIKGAMALCDASRGPIPVVIKAGLLRWDKGRKHVERALETAGAVAMSKLERGLPVLASVANISPLMGFLGTVTGMIRSFGVIAKAGLSNPGLVAQGISEALITTASGLIIAIPTLAAYNYFTSVVAKTSLQMDECTSQLLDQLQ